jgi:uncharacterized protein YicC (UPF0701 family)
VCPNCKKNARRGDNTLTPVKGICDTPPSTSVSPRSGDAVGRSADRDELRDRELALFMEEMREFRREMTQLRESLSARLDGVERRLDALEQREAEAPAADTERLERTIAELRIELNPPF